MTTISTTLQPLALEGDVLSLRAWRMPDIVVYQHNQNEWWVAPLDEDLPLIKLNRLGAQLLGAMDGRTTVGGLLQHFGKWVCGPTGETGRWHLERWSLPRYSLCYFGNEPPTGDRAEAKWDLLLQQVREKWSGQEGFEGEQHLSEFHLRGIPGEQGHFEIIETTVSHLFREPTEALHGLTYGRRLVRQLRQLGWWTAGMQTIVEVGGGLGYIAREMGRELSDEERGRLRYVFLDLTRPFLRSQMTLGRGGGWAPSASQATAEALPLRDGSVDLVIDNENLADMTPVRLTKAEVESGRGETPLHQDALDWIKRLRLPLDPDLPAELIVNYGALRFVMDLWRVLKPGGKAVLIEFGIDTGWPAAVKLPGHTEYEVQFTHLRQAARWLGFQEQYYPLPQFLGIKPDVEVLCTGAAYALRRFCAAEERPFSIRAYTQSELSKALGAMLPKVTGMHYHDVLDPAWFGLLDFKVLLLHKPGGQPRPSTRESKGFRWYTQG